MNTLQASATWGSVPRVARVEFPYWGHTEDVVFGSVEEAQEYAQKWALEDRTLVLVWACGAGMYVGRYDGRPEDAGICDVCDKWGDHLKTVDGDNPDRIRDICLICQINGY
jgi:hypothetical protein